MADAPKNQSCGNCRYAWLSLGFGNTGNAEVNRCRRHSPQLKGGDGYDIVSIADWCGEYSPANPGTVSEAATTIARMVLMGDAAAAYALIDKLQEDRPAPAPESVN